MISFIRFAFAIVALIVLSAVADVRADQIKFETMGVGSGFLGVSLFSSQPFTITSIADTSLITSNGFSYGVNNLLTTVQLGATNLTALAGSSYAAITAVPQFATFMWSNANVGDFIDTPELYITNPAFFGYDLTTAIGPVAGTNSALSIIITNQGYLSFQSTSQVQFVATIVPEPSTLALAASTAFATLGMVQRRRARIG